MQSKLTFIKKTGVRRTPSGNTRSVGLFKCSCGTEKEICISSVNRGVTTSCGCKIREQIRKLGKLTGKKKSSYRHGMFGTRFHQKYFGIVQRCKPHMRFYGQCGIRNDFKNFDEFYKEMYPSYLKHVKKHGERQTTLDRIDPSKNYSVQNCRWATYTEQGRNRKNNLILTIDGQTKTLAEWVEKTGLSAWFVKKLAKPSA